VDPLDFDHISSKDLFLTFSKEEQEAILAMRSIKKYKKGTMLLKDGDRITHSLFVMKGCVRQFKLKEGIDKTNLFYTEDESIHLPPARYQTAYSNFNLECLEDCEISVVSMEKERAFCQKFPRFEQMCRLESERLLIEFQDFFATYISSSAEERYLHLLDTRPDLLSRVPQYHLATYLGVTAESLSRIRKRVAQR